MDKTAGEIEAHIDRTRERLGSHLKELEAKVDAATDWRQHVRERPFLFLGVAFVGGGILASGLRAKPAHGPANGSIRRFADTDSSVQALAFWNSVKGALIGVVAARTKNYISGWLPEFDEHYTQAEYRAGGAQSGGGRDDKTTV